ncbi:hypothetical protein GMMP13_390019 [Candidatus Magnetomoraceae bacterium gMMP-13]
MISYDVIPGVLELTIREWISQHRMKILSDKQDFLFEIRDEVSGQTIEEAVAHPYFDELVKYGLFNIENGKLI